MRGMIRALSVVVVGLACLVATAEIASAQSIVRATYRVALTDPATGNVYFSDRESIRSWSSEESCEREKNSFSGFHTRAMSKLNIVNAEGTPLEVSMDSIYCLVIRE